MGKRYRVELTTLAREQILQIAQYIKDELQAPETAEKLVDFLETEIAKLDTMPERAVLVDEEPWRSRGVHKYIMGHYIAYFIVIEPAGIVRVMAVALERRDQRKQLDNVEL